MYNSPRFLLDVYCLHVYNVTHCNVVLTSKKTTYSREPVATPCMTVTARLWASSSLEAEWSMASPAPAPATVVREKVRM